MGVWRARLELETAMVSVIRCRPRGFCAGVERAIQTVEKALEDYGPPIYVFHDIVHNRFVVEDLMRRGVIFVENPDDVPSIYPVILSAHGVSLEVKERFIKKKHTILDATCPLVSKVHYAVMRYSRLGYDCFLIGHANHPEIIGTLGHFDASNGGKIQLIQTPDDAKQCQPSQTEKLSYATQTTLSIDETQTMVQILKDRFPGIVTASKEDICYATQNRQSAVKELMMHCDVIIVIGSARSSNTQRLYELAKSDQRIAYRIDDASELDRSMVSMAQLGIGVTSGASAPEFLVEQVIQLLSEWGYPMIDLPQNPDWEESIVFKMPLPMRAAESI